MSLANRITALRRKHSKLAEQIEQMVALPATPQDQITNLKKEKLKLKDEIARLQTRSSGTAKAPQAAKLKPQLAAQLTAQYAVAAE